MAEDIPISSPPPPLIPFLPDDISILCIARVPASTHTVLSHVSRSWRFFVRSPSFFSLRSELAVTELVVTVSIRSLFGDRSRWYHLHPHQPPSPLPPTLEQDGHVDDIGTTSVSLGPRLFLLGGVSSPHSVQIYDARLRQWSRGPSMSTARTLGQHTAWVAGGRLLVLGSNDLARPPSIESLDLVGTHWDPVPPIPDHLCGKWWWRNGAVDGKLVIVSVEPGGTQCSAAFDPNTAEWSPAPPRWVADGPMGPLAVVGGVPYLFDDIVGSILGYGSDGLWRPVEGELLKDLIRRLGDDMRLLDFGGLLCLVGEETEWNDELKTISCAVIDVSRTEDGGFTGKVIWSDSCSLVLPKEESIHHCVMLEF